MCKRRALWVVGNARVPCNRALRRTARGPHLAAPPGLRQPATPWQQAGAEDSRVDGPFTPRVRFRAMRCAMKHASAAVPP
jgi:hypothetical protein